MDGPAGLAPEIEEIIKRITRFVSKNIYIFNVRDGRPEFSSQSAGEMIGYSMEEVVAFGDNFMAIMNMGFDAYGYECNETLG